MKKILILTNLDSGLYKFRKELIQEMIDQGDQVFIALPDGPYIKSLTDMGCRFIDADLDRRGINPVRDFRLLRHYMKIVDEIRPDLLVTYTIKPNLYGGIAGRIKKVPYAMNVTGLGTAFQKDGLLKDLVVFLYRIAGKHAKTIFFENEENRQVFIDKKIVGEEKACRLNGAGVNLEEFQFCGPPCHAGETHFLFMGRIMKEKGVDELFEAAERIMEKYGDVVFDILGTFEEDYRQRVEALEDKGCIRYYGFQADVRPFIRQADCFVLPSYHEGMANTLLECAAMGRPLITSDIPGCREAVIDGETGYLVRVKDSRDLYEKMEDFLRLSRDERMHIGEKGRCHIENAFDKKKVVEATISRLMAE
ncbi:glycosyltransferase family 4 protein [Anaerobium acetethylicum]|uniref:Galacturonosyltransferase n=1 Tax=Anaerobium acetethylicum TaxID=1619234 RepID=A0A1D3TRD7_9FIRM|nr:glycosyltransferase family 4 protein [Anaerobium acetethylicum]SCP96269.1 galacturonosyltransferase [Anaerobium acetethylicum]